MVDTEEFCDDYPLGGSLEPYDIWRDIEILENARQRLFSRKKDTHPAKRMDAYRCL
jgi:hypothetical protein